MERRGLQSAAQIAGRQRAARTRAARERAEREAFLNRFQREMREAFREERLHARRCDLALGRDPLRLVVCNRSS
jgi:hypothetical protein